MWTENKWLYIDYSSISYSKWSDGQIILSLIYFKADSCNTNLYHIDSWFLHLFIAEFTSVLHFINDLKCNQQYELYRHWVLGLIIGYTSGNYITMTLYKRKQIQLGKELSVSASVLFPPGNKTKCPFISNRFCFPRIIMPLLCSFFWYG